MQSAVVPMLSAELAADHPMPTTRIENGSSIETTPVEGDRPTAAPWAPLGQGVGRGAELHAVALAMQKATVPPQVVPAALVAHRRKYHGLLRDSP